ncbi:MAG: methyltransferase domain-containing protein [Chloroflexota bacterium]
MADKGKGILKRVSTLQPGDKSDDIYDDWAATYDRDLVETYGYLSPQIVTEALLEYCPETAVSIIDYGCGTGLIGEALHQRGYRQIDGLDVSEGMLVVARQKNVYTKLMVGDLTQSLNISSNHYDVMLSIGIFGNGHVEPQHLPEMVRTVKVGGLILLYTNGQPYIDDDYATSFAEFEQAGLWKILKTEASNYMATLDRPGYLVVARKAGD